jgi:hypothetical protein
LEGSYQLKADRYPVVDYVFAEGFVDFSGTVFRFPENSVEVELGLEGDDLVIDAEGSGKVKRLGFAA